jgi:isocitrate dehydrogenase (NAD+)
MLRAMNLTSHADLIENSVYSILEENKHTTKDLGGRSTTTEYTKAIISNL